MSALSRKAETKTTAEKPKVIWLNRPDRGPFSLKEPLYYPKGDVDVKEAMVTRPSKRIFFL